MKKKLLLKSKYFRIKFPLSTVVIVLIALDYWNAAEWIYGAFGVLFSILLIVVIMQRFDSEEASITDILREEERSEKENKS